MSIEYAAAAGVARITLNRPEKRNAITSEMMAAARPQPMDELTPTASRRRRR